MMTLFLRRCAISLTMAIAATAATANPVTIKLTDGNFVLVGTLISDNGLNYLVKTEFGTLQIAKSVSTCDGCGPAIMALAK